MEVDSLIRQVIFRSMGYGESKNASHRNGIDDKDNNFAKETIDECKLALIEWVRGQMSMICDNPKQVDGDGKLERCGGCYPCIKDQALESLIGELK